MIEFLQVTINLWILVRINKKIQMSQIALMTPLTTLVVLMKIKNFLVSKFLKKILFKYDKLINSNLHFYLQVCIRDLLTFLSLGPCIFSNNSHYIELHFLCHMDLFLCFKSLSICHLIGPKKLLVHQLILWLKFPKV